MYICVCKAVSDKQLKRAVDSGSVISLRDLTRELGVGTCCGKCVPAAREALGAALSLNARVEPSTGGFLPGTPGLAACGI